MNMRQDKGKSAAVVTTWWQILQNKWHIMTNDVYLWKVTENQT